MTDYGLFAIDQDTRTAHGILLPWGVKSKGKSKSATRPITFPRGNVTLPRDPMIVGLNDEHDRFSVIGRAVTLEDREEGVYAAFAIANTDEGDAWLAEHGDKAYFSAEIAHLTRDADDLGGGVLAGAAVTAAPAFDGTAVAMFSLIDEDEDDEDTEPAPAEPDEEPDQEPDEEEEEAVAEATAPATMLASRRTAPALTRRGFIKALHAAYIGSDADLIRPYIREASEVGLFALDDVLYDDATAGLVKDFPGAWLGELWRAVPNARPFLDTLNIGTLTDMKAVGWLLDVPEDAVAAWAGNKTEVPSEPITTGLQEYEAQRFSGANDLSREYWDFNKLDVIDAYTRGMILRYKQKSDAYAMTEVLTGASPVVLGTVPVGANKGLTALYDLTAAVIDAGGTPTVFRAGAGIHREIKLTLDGDQFAYMDGAAESNRLERDPRLASREILVADKNGILARELPGSPIRVDALEIARGGVDRGFFGYIAAGVVDPATVVKATVAA